MHLNFEFKAKCIDLEGAETLLLTHNPVFIGTDHQTDTYFKVENGRLKLREGNIENALIHYSRSNIAGAKQSDVLLYQHQPHPALKEILTRSFGIKMIVDKERKIYFIDNVKFHFDAVQELGKFIEVEAIDMDGSIGIEKLKEQCTFYAAIFGIGANDFVAGSYSDLLMEKKSSIS